MTNWQNRIVEYGTADPAELLKLANPMNPRRHPEFQAEAVEGSLNEVGWVQDVIVNKTTGKMLDGHLRVKSAVKTGQAEVPVKYVELTEAEEALVLATLDYTTNLAEFDDDVMKSLLSQLDTDEPGLMAMLDEMRDEFGVNGAGGDGEGTDTEPAADRAEELRVKWGVEPGQLWQLGDHRLICGDCTDPAVVNAVASGDSIQMWYCDPPYAVGYADKNASLNAVAKGNRIQTPIENDHLSVDETSKKVWLPAFKNLFDISSDGCAYYCSAPQGGDQMMMMMMMLCEASWLVKHEIIWVKNNHVLGRADYQYKHEPIIYGWKPGAGHYFIDSRSEMSVWEIDKPHNSDMHPTTKPVGLIERAIRNSSKPGWIVADFFVGSGTTIIACENLSRRCRAIEIDAGYVGVTLERFQTHTGITPTLLHTHEAA